MALPTTITGSLFTQNSYHGPFNFVGSDIAENALHSIFWNLKEDMVSVGTTATSRDEEGEQWACSFTPSSTATCTGVKLSVAKVGSPTDNLIIEIQSDSSGDPDGTAIASVTIAATDLPVESENIYAYQMGRVHRFDSTVSLSASTTYWIVVRRSGSLNATNFYRVARGTTAVGKRLRSSTWADGSHSMWYQILDDTEKTYAVINNSGAIEVAMSTDPTSASSFSNQDAANNPTAAPACVWAVDKDTDFAEIGAAIIVSTETAGSGMSATVTVETHVFDFVTDTWVRKDQQVENATASADMVSADASASLCLFANGALFLVYNGATEADMGNGYNRVYYNRRYVNTWGGATLLHSAPTGDEDWFGSVVVGGSSDRAHCFFLEGGVGSSDLYQRTWREATTDLETESNGTGGQREGHIAAKGVSYDDGATRRVRAPFNNVEKLAIAKIDSGDTPGAFTSDTNVNDSGSLQLQSLQSPSASIAADGTTLHAVWAESSGSDRIHHDKNEDDGGWGTDDNPFNLATSNTVGHVSANVYTRAGTKRLAVVVLDGTDVKYDEYDLEAAATSLVIPNKFVQRFPHLRM